MSRPPVSRDNVFEQYFDYVKDTESPLLMHRWSLITCLGAMLGRQVWIPFGSFRIFPNQYVMLIGDPGARKSAAIKIAKKLISKAGYSSFSAEKTTKEKFLLDLEGAEEDSDGKVTTSASVMETLFGSSVEDNLPREVFIVADEFNDFMRCGDLEFHSMLGALWDYDDETTPYKQRLKNSKPVSIYQPTISLLGGNTHTGFAEMFPPQAIGQGFLSRMLLVFSEPTGRKIAFPTPPDPVQELALVRKLQSIRHNMKGPMTLTAKAKGILETLYRTYIGFTDVRFTSYFTRRYTHLLKMCMLCAAADERMAIGELDVILANSLLHYTEHFMPRALGEFGKAKNADVASKILNLLQKSLKPVDTVDLWKQCSSDLNDQGELAKILDGLRTANKISWVKKTDKGVQGWLIVRKALGDGVLYTDFSWLREYEAVRI